MFSLPESKETEPLTASIAETCCPSGVTFKCTTAQTLQDAFLADREQAQAKQLSLCSLVPVSWGVQLLAPLCLCCLQGRYFQHCLNVPGQVS